MKLPVCVGIFIIIPAAEIGEMTLEDLMEGVSSPGKVLGPLNGLLDDKQIKIMRANLRYLIK